MKPQDVFISARDFFAILVPGALLILLLPLAEPGWDVIRWLKKNELPGDFLKFFGWFVFSYAAGTLLWGIASQLDKLVDPFIARRVRLSATAGSGRMFKLSQTERMAHELERTVLPGITRFATQRRPWSTRAFWWNYLRLNCPAAIAELDRIEGQQKQFRSMAVAAFILAFCHPLNFSLAYPYIAFDPGRTGLVAAAFYLISVCFLIYVYGSFRVRFSRRLFELAIVHAVPPGIFTQNSGAFFGADADWAARRN